MWIERSITLPVLLMCQKHGQEVHCNLRKRQFPHEFHNIFFEIQLGIISARTLARFWPPFFFWGINQKSTPHFKCRMHCYAYPENFKEKYWKMWRRSESSKAHFRNVAKWKLRYWWFCPLLAVFYTVIHILAVIELQINREVYFMLCVPISFI